MKTLILVMFVVLGLLLAIPADLIYTEFTLGGGTWVWGVRLFFLAMVFLIWFFGDCYVFGDLPEVWPFFLTVICLGYPVLSVYVAGELGGNAADWLMWLRFPVPIAVMIVAGCIDLVRHSSLFEKFDPEAAQKMVIENNP